MNNSNYFPPEYNMPKDVKSKASDLPLIDEVNIKKDTESANQEQQNVGLNSDVDELSTKQLDGLNDNSKNDDIYELQYNYPTDASVVPIKGSIAESKDPLLTKTKVDGSSEIKFGVLPLSNYFKHKFNNTLDKIGEDQDKSVSDTLDAYDELAKDNITEAEAKLRLVGNSANFGLDVTGEILISGLSVVGDGISIITPDFIEDPLKDLFKNSVSSLLQSDSARKGLEMLANGIEYYNEFKVKNPRAAENIEAVFDISLVASPSIIPKNVKPRTVFKALLQTPKGLYKENKTWFDIFDMGGADTIKRTGSEGVNFTARELTAIDSLKKSKVSPIKTANSNALIIVDNIQELGNKITDTFKNSSKTVDAPNMMDDLDNSVDLVREQGVGLKGVGDAIESVTDVLQEQLKKYSNPDGTISVKNTWEVRKAIDAWHKKKQGEQAFNKTGDVPDAVYAVRDALNRAIYKEVPEVKDLITKQSGFLFALSNVSKKASKETGGLFNNIMHSVLSLAAKNRNITVGLIGLLGTGGTVGYSTVASPVALAGMLGVGTYLAGSTIIQYGISPAALRRNMGGVLSGIDSAILAARKANNSVMVQTLKADKAALLELVKVGRERYDNGGKEELEQLGSSKI